MNKHIIGNFENEGDGVCTAKVYTPKGFYKGTISVSNGAAFDNQPSGTILSKSIGKASKGVEVLTSIGYINIPEYEFETQTNLIDFELEGFYEMVEANADFFEAKEFENWQNLMFSNDKKLINLGFDILKGLQTLTTTTQTKCKTQKR